MDTVNRLFKDTNDEVFGIEPGQEFLIQDDWIEITSDDLRELQKPTDYQLKQSRLFELKRNLANTDFKVLPDYDRSDQSLISQRQEWRDEIRYLEDELGVSLEEDEEGASE